MQLLTVIVFLGVTVGATANMMRWYSNITCSDHLQCHETMGNRSNCVYDMCQCMGRYHMADSGLCIPDKGVHELCDSQDECYWGPEMIGKIHCHEGICSCQQGYIIASGRICIRIFSDSGTFIISSPILVYITILISSFIKLYFFS